VNPKHIDSSASKCHQISAWDEADVPRELTASERRKAVIAQRVITLTKEIAAIRGSEDHPLFTHEELKWWRDNRPSFLILNLGLSSEEIIGHVTAKDTTPKWAAVAIVAGLTHWTGPKGLTPNTVEYYSRRYRKLVRYLSIMLAYTVLQSSLHSLPYPGFVSHADNAALQCNEHVIKPIKDWARSRRIPIQWKRGRADGPINLLRSKKGATP
jgi:hypothetical protein